MSVEPVPPRDAADADRSAPGHPTELGDTLHLPCGLVLPNRIAKAAMTECLADPRTNDPNVRHERLYERWARGGVGLQVTGNVMVDRRYLERTTNVVVDELTDRAALERWALAAQSTGAAGAGAGEPPGPPVQRVRLQVTGGTVGGQGRGARLLRDAARVGR